MCVPHENNKIFSILCLSTERDFIENGAIIALIGLTVIYVTVEAFLGINYVVTYIIFQHSNRYCIRLKKSLFIASTKYVIIQIECEFVFDNTLVFCSIKTILLKCNDDRSLFVVIWICAQSYGLR